MLNTFPFDLRLLVAVLACIVLVLYFSLYQRRRITDSPANTEFFLRPAFLSRQLNSNMLAESVSMAAAWIWITDQQHRYQFISRSISNHTAFDPHDLENRYPWDILWKAANEAAWEEYRQHAQQGLPVSIVVESIVASPTPGAPPLRRYFKLTGLPIFREGKIQGYHGISQNITENLELCQLLATSQLRNRELMNTARQIVFYLDREGLIEQTNHAWSQLTSTPLAEVVGKPLLHFIHPGDRVRLQTLLKELFIGSRDSLRGEFRLMAGDGTIRWVEALFNRLRPHAELFAGDATFLAARPLNDGLTATFSDITARKVAEMTLRNTNSELERRVRQRTAELQASNQELEAFSYSVSHDLRAPLRSIDGFANILADDLGDNIAETTSDYLNRIRAASQRMNRLIDNLIKNAQVVRQPLRKENVNLSEMVLQIVEDLKVSNPGRKVEVNIMKDLYALCDRTLIRVALENLIGNAWKYSSQIAFPRISFSASHNGKERVFSISDNGVGFDMAFADKLFLPFQRLSTDHRFAGSGIGLANTKKVIERHNGRIWAHSTPEDTTSFFFTIQA